MRPEEMIGQMLGHYRIIRPLGYGGSATIFLAEDVHLQREVAVKVFRPPSENAQDFLRRFAREARVLAQLDHPNILPVYEYGEEGTIAYLVMPHMTGGSLRDWLRGRGAISANETVQLMSQILSALQYAHERNLIHRDIKPGNMLFKGDRTLMLSDFGLVKVLTGGDGNWSPLDESSTNLTSQMLTGTPDYMAPEQINGKVIPASDIYAMGVVLYEMLTGTRLFHADNYISVLMKHLHEQPRPLREINSRLSPELENIVLRALSKEPAQRYQRPSDLRQALLQAIREDSAITQSSTITTQTAINTIPSVQLPSTQSKENSKPVPPVYLQDTSSTHITPSSTTQSDGQVSIPSAPLPTNKALSGSAPPKSPQAPIPLQLSRSNRPLIIALILIILVLTTSLGGVLYSRGNFKQQTAPTHSNGTIIARSKQTATGSTPVVNKGGTTPGTGNNGNLQTLSSTQTDCPASGEARSVVTAQLVLGNQQNIIYIVNEGTPTHPTFGTIKRREANPNVAGVEISKMPQTFISEAQVSRDGQWVLFVANTGGRSQLRMVRVDGQGLQTLYCAPTNATISHSQWSFDQSTIIFNIGSSADISTTYLLDATTGRVQAELVPQSTQAYIPRTWLDNTHVYMTSSTPNVAGSIQNLYLLDITKGTHQHDGDLQKIIPGPQACGSFDSSYNSQQLFISTCQPTTSAASTTPAFAGPTIITSEPAIGGATRTLATLSTAVTMLREVTPNTLLLLLENSIGNTTQNGLWKMNSDGTGLTQLSSDTHNTQSLCPFSQYAWSNLSRDNSMYALQEIDIVTNTYKLYYGSMSDESPYQFAGISGTQLLLAGWTSM